MAIHHGDSALYIIEAIVKIRNAIDQSCQQKDDTAWKVAISDVGLLSQGDTGGTSIDESFQQQFGPVTLGFRHTCRDTSRTFSIGPDRTTLTLTLIVDGPDVDRYTNGYED